MKTQSALPWFGSDSEVAEGLGAKFDRCKHVTVLMCGGLGILPYLKASHVLANDKHEEAINFYRVASGFYGKDAQSHLFERCKATLSHPGEMKLALERTDSICRVTSAWAFWVVCWLGRKGKGGTKSQGGKPSIRRSADGGSNASRIQAAADDLSTSWATEHFPRCEWECEDFLVILPKIKDRKDCGVYADPPWDGPGADYLHSFKEEHHVQLRDGLLRFKEAKIVVRYGDTPFIRELYSGWDIEEAEFRDQVNQVKPELWISRN